METLSCILSRHSIRKFKKIPVGANLGMQLIQAGFSAPSACDQRPWEFITIDSQKILELLQINAPLVIVICGKSNNINTVKPFLSETWIQDCSAAAENILLAAHNCGLGACWHIMHPLEKYQEFKDITANIKHILEIPDNVIPLCYISIGYPDDTNAIVKNKMDFTKCHWNKW